MFLSRLMTSERLRKVSKFVSASLGDEHTLSLNLAIVAVGSMATLESHSVASLSVVSEVVGDVPVAEQHLEILFARSAFLYGSKRCLLHRCKRSNRPRSVVIALQTSMCGVLRALDGHMTRGRVVTRVN